MIECNLLLCAAGMNFLALLSHLLPMPSRNLEMPGVPQYVFHMQMLDLKVKVDSSEAERDYYYDKLRSIEILCQMPELQDVGVSPPTRFCLSHDPREISLPISRRTSNLSILSATSPKSLDLTEVLPKPLSFVC